jgi:hypothetical protein
LLPVTRLMSLARLMSVVCAVLWRATGTVLSPLRGPVCSPPPGMVSSLPPGLVTAAVHAHEDQGD